MKQQPKQTKPTHRDKDGLNLREKLFCLNYVIERANGAAAAKAAGYSGDLKTRASRLLDNPKIIAVIQREGAKLVAKAEVKAERVILELARIAFADVRNFFRPDNTLVPLATLSAETAALISGVDLRRGALRVRFANRIQALSLLGQHLKLWDGAGNGAVDRLSEVLAAFREGPVEIDKDKKEPTSIQ